MTGEPIKPEGVVVHRADGSVLPAELVYVGIEEGCHQWQVAGIKMQQGDVLHVDMLPGRTGINFDWQREQKRKAD